MEICPYVLDLLSLFFNMRGHHFLPTVHRHLPHPPSAKVNFSWPLISLELWDFHFCRGQSSNLRHKVLEMISPSMWRMSVGQESLIVAQTRRGLWSDATAEGQAEWQSPQSTYSVRKEETERSGRLELLKWSGLQSHTFQSGRPLEWVTSFFSSSFKEMFEERKENLQVSPLHEKATW